MSQGSMLFRMLTTEENADLSFAMPCNDAGFIEFRSADEVDAFVEKLKTYRDAAYGKLEGEPL